MRLLAIVLTDRRLLAAAFLAIVLRIGFQYLFVWSLEEDYARRTHPPQPAPIAAQATRTASRLFGGSRIERINADGTSAEPPMSPIAAAAAVGGMILGVGGIGAYWMWRRADEVEEEVDPRFRR